MDTFAKAMSQSELEVTKLAASLGVGPQVVSYEPTTAIRKEYTFVPEDPLSEWECWKYENANNEPWYLVQLEKLDKLEEITPEQYKILLRKVKILLEHGIIHIDIHRDNIMIKNYEPYIIDYGWVITTSAERESYAFSSELNKIQRQVKDVSLERRVTTSDMEMYPVLKEYWNIEALKLKPEKLVCLD